jgi:hypothetical protein
LEFLDPPPAILEEENDTSEPNIDDIDKGLKFDMEVKDTLFTEDVLYMSEDTQKVVKNEYIKERVIKDVEEGKQIRVNDFDHNSNEIFIRDYVDHFISKLFVS